MKLAPICQGSHFPYLWKKEDVALHGHIPGAAYKSHAALDSLSFYLQVLVTNFKICNKPPGPCLPTATHPPFSLLFSTVLGFLSYSPGTIPFFFPASLALAMTSLLLSLL